MKNTQAMNDVVRARLAALAQATDGTGGETETGNVPEGTFPRLERAWRFGREHLVAVGVVLLVGVASTVWATFRAHTTPVAVEAAPQVTVTSDAPAAAASPSPTPPRQIQVHVLGAVSSPGVVTLPEGARVHEAVEAAGGMRPDARPGSLNLAAIVADGSQIVIGDKKDPGGEVSGQGAGGGASGAPGGSDAVIDLNTASAEQLQTLPGVGPVTATNIIDWRTANGRFNSVSELTEVSGIGPKTLARLQDRVRAG